MQIVLSPRWAVRTSRLTCQRFSVSLYPGVFTTKFLHSGASSDPKALWKTRNIGIIAHIDAVRQIIILVAILYAKLFHRVKPRRQSVCSIIVAIRAELAVLPLSLVKSLPQCLWNIKLFCNCFCLSAVISYAFPIIFLDVAYRSVLINVFRCR